MSDSVYKNDTMSSNDKEILLDKNEGSESEISIKKNGIMNTLKKGSKLLYNTTLGELRNGRMPILDSAYRTLYRKSLNPNNPKGTEVFQKNEGYYRLGGKYRSHRKRKNKIKSRKNRKTRKNKK
jgi:hypothetical protein